MANHMKEIKQIGFATTDIERAIENFKKIGLTDWSPVEEVTPEDFSDMVCDGKPQPYSMLCATNYETDIELEIIQPLDEYSDYFKWLKKLDTWIAMHHLSVESEDIEELQSSGRELLLAGHSNGIPFGWNYFDFRDEIGTVLEYFPAPMGGGSED